MTLRSLGGAALLLAWAAACARPAAPPVRVAVMPWLSNAPIYLAEDLGYFGEVGVRVELVKLRQQDAIPALLGGKVDVAVGRLSVGLFNPMNAGARLAIVAEKGRVPAPGAGCAHDGFLVPTALAAEGALTVSAALRGKRIAVLHPYSLEQMFVERLLEKAGVARSEVTFIDLDVRETLEALRVGGVDLKTASEPALTQARLLGVGATWLPVGAVMPGQQSGVVVFGARLLDREKELGRRVVSAYLRAVREINKGKSARLISALARRTELPEPVVREACWGTLQDDGEIDVASVVAFQRWAHERGILERVVPPERFWDPSFVRAAR